MANIRTILEQACCAFNKRDRRSIQGLRRMQRWLCCLWNWYAVSNQEASQTSVLFQQPTNLHSGSS
jgi:hypothetical protein